MTATENVVPDAEPEKSVTAHESCPGKFVFTEEDNSDGWISSDLIVSLER